MLLRGNMWEERKNKVGSNTETSEDVEKQAELQT